MNYTKEEFKQVSQDAPMNSQTKEVINEIITEQSEPVVTADMGETVSQDDLIAMGFTVSAKEASIKENTLDQQARDAEDYLFGDSPTTPTDYFKASREGDIVKDC
jgi:hypothetical protein